MIGAELRAVLEGKGLAIPAAARLLGVSRVTLWRWTAGKAHIPKVAEPAIRALPSPTPPEKGLDVELLPSPAEK